MGRNQRQKRFDKLQARADFAEQKHNKAKDEKKIEQKVEQKQAPKPEEKKPDEIAQLEKELKAPSKKMFGKKNE